MQAKKLFLPLLAMALGAVACGGKASMEPLPVQPTIATASHLSSPCQAVTMGDEEAVSSLGYTKDKEIRFESKTISYWERSEGDKSYSLVMCNGHVDTISAGLTLHMSQGKMTWCEAPAPEDGSTAERVKKTETAVDKAAHERDEAFTEQSDGSPPINKVNGRVCRRAAFNLK